MPGLWLHWDGSFIDFCLFPGNGFVYWGFLGGLYPGCGRGVWFVSPLPEVWAFVTWLVCLFPVCGGLVCVLFLVCPAGGLGFFWLGCLLAYVGFLYWADAPSPMFLGEVLSGFRFLWEPWLLVLFLVVCGALPFWK